MISQIFTVYDHAVQAYLPPFFTRSKGEAVRSFSDACNNKEHQFYLHATDYSLFYLGEFNDGNGAFNPSVPVRILGAHECISDDRLSGSSFSSANGKIIDGELSSN